MSKYKIGDKLVIEIAEVIGDDEYRISEFIETEPLSTYTEPLEAKIRRQAAEITRLLEENKELKNKEQELARERNQLMGRCGGLSAALIKEFNKGRLAGQNEVWELTRKIVRQPINGGYKQSEFEEIFGCGYISDIFEKYTYPAAAAKVAEWEKTKEEIKVGDVYRSEVGNYFAIRNTDGEKGVAKILFMSNGEVTPDYIKSYCTKTGRYIDIDSFLKQIGGE